jgi:peptidoglycan/LPS O-acetylase OafA/YrhL
MGPRLRDAAAEPNLDILRSMAVGCVLYAHVAGRNPWVWTGIGRYGVLIFFVHTSLVLMLSLGRLRADGAGLFAAFYVRRAFRVYPLSMTAVLAAVLLHIPPFASDPYRAVSLGQFLSNFFLTQNLTGSASVVGPLWSLPYEIQMYLLLPVIYLVFRARSAWGVLALWGVTALVCIPTLPAALSVGNFAPCFLGGILAWRMRQRNWIPAWVWAPFIAAMCALFAYSRFDRRYTGWLVCLLLGAAIPLFRPVANRAVVFLAHSVAKYSYGIYLAHEPLLWLVFRHLHAPKLVKWAVFLPLLVLVPMAAFHLIENPCIKLGTRFAKEVAKRFADGKRQPGATAALP